VGSPTAGRKVSPRPRQAARASMVTAMHYIDCSLPEDVTLAEYRRTRCAARPQPRGLRRLFARA